MNRTIANTLSPLAVGALALSVAAGCQIREPFEVTVVAAGVDGAKVRTGIFNQAAAYETLEDGSVLSTEFEPAYQRGGRIFGPETTWLDEEVPRDYALSPIQSASDRTGSVTMTLPDPPPDQDAALFVASWYDANDNGRLDLSLDGRSEQARTIWYWDEDEQTKVYLWSYRYIENGTDPYYTATALGATNGTNYILDDGAVQNQAWMTLLTGAYDDPVVEEEDDSLDEADETVE